VVPFLRRRAVPILVSAALSVAAIVAAQAPATPDAARPQTRPTFETGVNFVRLDVYPTRDGKPIDGLRAEDFEVLEDGVPQHVTSFEHVIVASGAHPAEQHEPGTAGESRALASVGRNRVFILFLDVPHVSEEASRDIATPILHLLDRLLAPDDLIGVMLAGMRPSDVVLGRKTEVLQTAFRGGPWGERSSILHSPVETMYGRCYGAANPEKVQEMVARAQERTTLESLRTSWTTSARSGTSARPS
jgi:hypothetical protein